jgi:hypothetical protein
MVLAETGKRRGVMMIKKTRGAVMLSLAVLTLATVALGMTKAHAAYYCHYDWARQANVCNPG